MGYPKGRPGTGRVASSGEGPDRAEPDPTHEAPAHAYCKVDHATAPQNPWVHRVPPAVKKAFLDPGRCLVVGDAPGDPDCFNSALAWARARKQLGLHAEAHVDAPPPRSTRSIAEAGELIGAEAVSQGRYHTVVLVDNDGLRVGPAAQDALRKADHVVVVEHHDVHPTHRSLGLPKDAELTVWKDTEADAAALLTLATVIAAVRDAGAEWTKSAWSSVLEPVVAATYSDTRGFCAERTRPTTLPLIRHLIDSGAVDVRRALRGFHQPFSSEVSALLQEGLAGETERHGTESLGRYHLDAPAVLEAFHRARAEDPEATWSDLVFMALDHVERASRDHSVSFLTVGVRTKDISKELLAHLPDAVTKFSVRSTQPEIAPKLAAHLGGGGKPHEAGGLSSFSAHELHDRVSEWMKARTQLATEALMRTGGSLSRLTGSDKTKARTRPSWLLDPTG